MTQWFPEKAPIKRPAFLSLANRIEEAINSGELEPGDRLPPQREMAAAVEVSLQTVSRAYQELHRRNLVLGEIGRGTYVRARQSARQMPFGTERMAGNTAELSIFKPVVDNLHERILKETLTRLGTDISRDVFFSFRPNEGLSRHRDTALSWLKHCGLTTETDQVMIINGVTQGTTSALLSLCKAGDTVLSESVSSHSFVALCSFLGLKVQGIPIDHDGIIPDAFEFACRKGNIAALYLIPSLANPCIYLMSGERRKAIVEIARKYKVNIIENDVLGPLVADKPAPIASIAPECTFYLTSFTKSILPGLRTGFLVVPPNMIREVRNRILATNWMATPLMAEIASHLIQNGDARKLLLWQRKALSERHKITTNILNNINFFHTRMDFTHGSRCPAGGEQPLLSTRPWSRVWQ